MLIFGRSPNLLLALLGALVNLCIVFQVGGFDPTPEQIAQINTFVLALVAFIANSDKVTAAAGSAARARLRSKGVDVDHRADDANATPEGQGD